MIYLGWREVVLVKKRAMSILLTLCMVLCLVPASVFADGSGNIMLWIALFVISGCVMSVTMIINKRKKRSMR